MNLQQKPLMSKAASLRVSAVVGVKDCRFQTAMCENELEYFLCFVWFGSLFENEREITIQTVWLMINNYMVLTR